MFKYLNYALHHNHTKKIFSIVIGYCLWFYIAQYQTVIKDFQAPVLIYDSVDKYVTQPEYVTIKVQGSRFDMYHLSPLHVNIHIDGSNITSDQKEIILGKENLFLPDTIKLIDLIPSHVTISNNHF